VADYLDSSSNYRKWNVSLLEMLAIGMRISLLHFLTCNLVD
jgi:hypothetical protein